MLGANARVVCLGIIWCGFAGGGLWFAVSLDEMVGVQREARPLDAPSERLERPRSPMPPRLSYAEVIALAKVAAKKELGKQFDDVIVKSVVFEPGTGLWSVSFDPPPSRRPSDGCLIVFVHDRDKTTDLQPWLLPQPRSIERE